MGIKIIHTVWTNPPLSKVASFCLDRLREINPGYDVRLHTGAELFGPYREAFLLGTSFEVQKADLIRLACLEKFGGWYVDLDMVALRSIEELEGFIQEPRLTVAQHTDKRLCNNVLYGEPGWECFDRARYLIHESLSRRGEQRTRAMYGPDLCAGLQEYGMVNIIPKELVNPYGTHVSAVKAFGALLEERDYWSENEIPEPVMYHLWGQRSKALDALGFGVEKNPWEVFSQRWKSGGSETDCGVNSKKCNAVTDIGFIRRVLDDYDCTVVNDAGCGDFNWIIDLPGIYALDYRGYDLCEPPLSKRLLPFVQLNIATHPMRPCDVILCRDTLFHFPNKEVEATLELFRQSAPFLIASSSPTADNSKRHQWNDVIQKCYSPVNLNYWLGEPLDSVEVRENRILGIWAIK
jgi:hypothetical protein